MGRNGPLGTAELRGDRGTGRTGSQGQPHRDPESLGDPGTDRARPEELRPSWASLTKSRWNRIPTRRERTEMRWMIRLRLYRPLMKLAHRFNWHYAPAGRPWDVEEAILG